MAVRGNIVGIDSPEALERALRTAYYLADEGLATAAYLGLRSASRCCWKARRVSARPKPQRPSPPCSAAA
jgi:hypothetical protein